MTFALSDSLASKLNLLSYAALNTGGNLLHSLDKTIIEREIIHIYSYLLINLFNWLTINMTLIMIFRLLYANYCIYPPKHKGIENKRNTLFR